MVAVGQLDPVGSGVVSPEVEEAVASEAEAFPEEAVASEAEAAAGPGDRNFRLILLYSSNWLHHFGIST